MTWTVLIGVFIANSGVKSLKNNNLRVAYHVHTFMVDECPMDERYAHMRQIPPLYATWPHISGWFLSLIGL